MAGEEAYSAGEVSPLMDIHDGAGSLDNTIYGAMNKEEIRDGVEEEESDQPQLPACSVLFRIHNVIAILSLSSLSVAQLLPSPHDSGIPFLKILLRFYIFLGCIIGVVIELDRSRLTLVNIFPSMESWVVRGVVYLFLGLVATEESTVSLKNLDSAQQFLSLVIANLVSAILWVSASGVIISGILYIIMGLLMMKGLKEKYEQENYIER